LQIDGPREALAEARQQIELLNAQLMAERQQNEQLYIYLTAERLNSAARAVDDIIQYIENKEVSRFFI
jgi:predicted TIM-barrel fold metal-dependent hydrolase